MPEQIDLGEFSFDDDKVLKQLENVKQRMFELRQEKRLNDEENRKLEKTIKQLIDVQKILESQGEKDSAQYKKITKDIENLTKQQENTFKRNLDIGESNKRLGREYRNLEKAIASISDSEGNRLTLQQAIAQATEDQFTSINAARESNKKLLGIRNELNLSTEEGARAAERINGELDKNNEFIKENVSEYEQQKINIGNYASAVDNLFDRLGIGNSILAKFVQNLIKSGDAGKEGQTSVMGFGTALRPLITGLQGATKAALAFIATPIGAVITVLVAGFALVKNALNRSESAVDALNRAFAPLVGILNKVLNALVPLGEFIINTLVDGIEHMVEVFVGGFNTLATVLEKVGLKSWASGMRDFADSINEAADANMALVESEILLTNINRKNTVELARQSAELSKQKEIRDNRNNSFEERNEAALRALEIENEMADAQRITAQLEFSNNERRIQEEGEISELLDKRAELTAKIIGIEKTAAEGRRRDQRRLQSLEREINKDREKQAADQLKRENDAIDKRLEAQKTELEIFEAEQGFRAKSAQEEIEQAREVSRRKLEILKAELEAERITEGKFQAEALKVRNDLAKKEAEQTAENLKRQLDQYIKNNQSRLQKNDLLTEEVFAQEKKRLNDTLTEEKRFQESRFTLGVISEDELTKKLLELDEGYRAKIDELDQRRREQQRIAEAMDVQNNIMIREQRFENDLERRAFQLERRRLQEVEKAERIGADVDLVNKKFAEAQIRLEDEVQKRKLQSAGRVAGQISEIVGQETAVGRAAAIAQATIDTYQAANNALASVPFPFNIIAAGTTIAAGLKNVANIVSTPKPKTDIQVPRGEKGMYITGKRHYQGGELIEAEQGEVIVNRQSVGMFPRLLSAINEVGGGVPYMERGGSLGASNMEGVQREILSLLDTESLAREIGEAVREGSERGSLAGSTVGSNRGIKELSVNQRIAEGSKF